MFSLIRGSSTSIILSFLGTALLLAGCASPPPAPLTDVEKSLYTPDPGKGSVVIYRSTEESWLNRPIPARIYIDGHPFIKLFGGEYVQVYLADGSHEIRVEYYRDCEMSTSGATQTLTPGSGHVDYLEVVPGIGRMTWIYCGPFQLVPYPAPMLGSDVQLVLENEEAAIKQMGKAVDEELIRIRRITK